MLNLVYNNNYEYYTILVQLPQTSMHIVEINLANKQATAPHSSHPKPLHQEQRKQGRPGISCGTRPQETRRRGNIDQREMFLSSGSVGGASVRPRWAEPPPHGCASTSRTAHLPPATDKDATSCHLRDRRRDSALSPLLPPAASRRYPRSALCKNRVTVVAD